LEIGVRLDNSREIRSHMTDITYPISYPTSFLSNLEVEQMVDSYFMIMYHVLHSSLARHSRARIYKSNQTKKRDIGSYNMEAVTSHGTKWQKNH
jgi:hypothetical protein